MRPAILTLLTCLPLAACAPTSGGGSGDDDDATAPEDDANACHGDALADSVPISDDLDALQERFDVNEDLVRIMFLGEPF